MSRLPLTRGVVVAGLGRCGTSLVMQMLHAAGIPCHGRWPDFEVEEGFHGEGGMAVKWLNPHRDMAVKKPPGVAFYGVWMKRNYTDQAASHAKFLLQGTGLQMDRNARRASVARFPKEEHMGAQSMNRICGQNGWGILQFQFLLENPQTTAHMLCEILRLPASTDTRKMAAQVVKRSPRLYPGSLEAELLERGEGKSHG